MEPKTKEPMEVLRPDSKGRITLGKRAAGVSGYTVTERDDGALLLEPQVEIPAREAWLYKNPSALAAVRQGLRESAEGKTVNLGSFAQYADLELDDEP